MSLFPSTSIHPYPRSWIICPYTVQQPTTSIPFVDTNLHDLLLVQRSILSGKSLDLFVEDQSLRLFSGTELFFSSRGVPAFSLLRTVCFLHTCLWTYLLCCTNFTLYIKMLLFTFYLRCDLPSVYSLQFFLYSISVCADCFRFFILSIYHIPLSSIHGCVSIVGTKGGYTE